MYTFESSLAERVTRGGVTSGGEAMKAPTLPEHYVENKCENKKCPKRHPADCDFSHDTLVSDDLKQNRTKRFNVSVATILGVKRKIQ